METPLLDFLQGFKEFEITAMARSAQRAVEIIVPWYSADHSYNARVVKDMQDQLRTYARAIDFSVDAAMSGYTVAEDALFLIENIRTASPEDRKDFLLGILSTTEKGLAQASAAQSRFIKVRTTVTKLVENMKAEQLEAKEIRFSKLSVRGIINVVFKSLGEIQFELMQGIHDLEEFSGILDKFTKWWNEIVMETKSRLERSQVVADSSLDKLDKLRVRDIQQKWENQKAKYCEYVNKIQAVQDQYPNVFKLRDTGEEVERTTEKLYTSMNISDVPTRCESPPPGYQLHKQPRMLCEIDDLERNVYISASLGMVQILPESLCFLQFDVQCSPSPECRISNLTIECRLSKAHPNTSHELMLYDVAPKLSIGARNEETHNRKLGGNMSIKSSGFVAAGAEINTEFQRGRVVDYATVITGFMRGKRQDSAKWTIVENPSVKTGVPSHFCVAIVVQFSGTFAMDLEVQAKQRGRFRLSLHPLHMKVTKELDIDTRKEDYVTSIRLPPESWREWFPLITGDVRGGSVSHGQVPVRQQN